MTDNYNNHKVIHPVYKTEGKCSDYEYAIYFTTLLGFLRFRHFYKKYKKDKAKEIINKNKVAFMEAYQKDLEKKHNRINERS